MSGGGATHGRLLRRVLLEMASPEPHGGTVAGAISAQAEALAVRAGQEHARLCALVAP